MPRNRGGRGTGRTPSRPSGRTAQVRLKTAKGRKKSSVRWLQRHLNDPYVQDAERSGYRSRAAWKLAQLDDRFRFLSPGARVVDLGAAPGGWTQVAIERTSGSGRVVAVDMVEIDPLPGAEFLQFDLREETGVARLREALGEPVDVVLSDMAAPSTGHRGTDRMRGEALAEAGHAFAREVLAPGGVLVLKVFQSGGEAELTAALKRDFERVRTFKPPASRSDSSEAYVVATGFRGGADPDRG